MWETVKKVAKKIAAGIAVAFTTPEAVAAEKSLAVVVVLRLALYLGAGVETIQIVTKIVESIFS